ncbi:hypothetical protein [Mesonia aestuariivivens]|uniref:Uncharacterized protein n=1 Tax=Mesonia aestuariivivens TaxID=2796128 RepID=A0ABS6VY98_9FLAO|nr:hypothetical protein [Mesonia aestuariivivens]MBW2960560.1 hypothetical protein [Mesonia aestuariivivens]
MELDHTELQALLEVLELLEAKDSRAYIEIQNTVGLQPIAPVFSKGLAQQIYYHPAVYADEARGFEWIVTWIPLLKKGFFPDEESAEKLVEFLYFGLAFLQSEKISTEKRERVFEVLHLLVHRKSEASLPVARFLMERAFDIRDQQSSSFIVQQSLKYKLLARTYFAKDSNDILKEFPFKITDDFVDHFYQNSFYLLAKSFHEVLPVSMENTAGAYELLKPWLTQDLAAFYAANEDFAKSAHQVLLERVFFVEDESFDYLNLCTAEGYYPLIAAFNDKEWNERDVLLFSLKDKNIPLKQTEPGFYKLQDWLLANNGINFNRPVFDNYGKAVLAVNSARELPVRSISLWLELSKAYHKNLPRKAYFNQVFACLLSDWKAKKLPVMSHEGEAFQVTGMFVLDDLLENIYLLKDWLPTYQRLGFADPLNQFLLLCFYDVRKDLKEKINEESNTVLYNYLITLAKDARETEPYLRETGVELCVKILVEVYKDIQDFKQVNEIASLKNIHPGVKAYCEEFAKSHYINTEIPLSINLIQSWYLFLNDYYYSLGKEALWVEEVLKNQGTRLANYFNENDEGSLPSEILFRLNMFLKMCSKHSGSYSKLNEIGSAISQHIFHLLQDLKPEKLSTQVVEVLYNYIMGHEINAYHNMQLESVILPFYEYYFQEEEEEEPDTTELPVESLLEEETTSPTTEPLVLSSGTKVNKEVLEQVISGLENYKTTGIDSSVYKTFIEQHETEIKALLEENMELKMKMYQVLYLLVIDLEAAPDSDYEAYGDLSRNFFVTLVKGNSMALSYAQGLEMMASSGAYPEKLTQALLKVVTNLKA